MKAAPSKPLPPTKAAPAPPSKAAPTAPAKASPRALPSAASPSASPRALPSVPAGSAPPSRLGGVVKRPPPLPPKAPSGAVAPPVAGRGRGRGTVARPSAATASAARPVGNNAPPVQGNRMRMPTLRAAAKRPDFLVALGGQEEEAKKPQQLSPPPASKGGSRPCKQCGHDVGDDMFCGQCGAPANETAQQMKDKASVDELLQDAEAHLQKKICVECYEEGYDAFCAQCGGRMIRCDDDDEDLLTVDDAPPPVLSSSASALDQLEQALLAQQKDAAAKPVAAPTKPSPAPVAVAANPVAANPVAANPVAAPTSSFVLPYYDNPRDEGYKQKVFVVDLGSEYVKFGWSTDTAEPSKIRACVDGRAAAAGGKQSYHSVKGSIFPFDAGAGSDTMFVENTYLVDLLKRVCQGGSYGSDAPLLLCSSVEQHEEGIGEWLYSWSEGQEVWERGMPPLVYLGFSPVLALMACGKQPSVFPTGVAVDIGATGIRVVPIYTGSKIDHAIQRSPFGGRMFQEYLGGKLGGARADEQTLAQIARESCFVALSFHEEMVKEGWEAAVLAPGQVYRGWKQKNAKQEKRVPVAGGAMSLGSERFGAPELFFQPQLVSRYEGFQPLHAMVRTAIGYCPRPIQALLLSNVVVCGDASRIPGFVERLAKELKTMYPTVPSLSVSAAPPNAAWKGGKWFASRAAFPAQCTSAADMQTLSQISHRFF